LWRHGQRAVAASAAAIVGYYVLFNASYPYWDGGWSYGPRFLGAALPFLCLGLAPLWSSAGRYARVGLVILACWGGMLAATAASTIPMPPDDVRTPITTLFWPALVGQLSNDALPAGAPGSVGRMLGLEGPAAVVPLLVAGVLVLLCAYGTFPGRAFSGPASRPSSA
jgi:hypothetical protein